MKHVKAFAVIVALALATGSTQAQPKMDGMKGMDMGGEKGMPMKDMPMDGAARGQTHQAIGTVKKVDVARGMVTIAHGPVASLKWPSMTMGFMVKDKALLDKLAVDGQVEFNFVKEGGGYTVTAVR
ncbi:copper-binding protein [Aromatoleum toluclasticum]|uniref:copper-binding protein n=1 Tax=Aromatoleum toluclasticum TaxID=92003 RepID=UPI001D1840FE|nr:copper-binding protein [Aromatoleum toluclasticum]MCC4118161.1 copper-binding protein [Aromatoleum toluclasticum]